MDPNATLAEIRALIERWQAAGSRGPWTEAEADEVIEKVADLDKWLPARRLGSPPCQPPVRPQSAPDLLTPARQRTFTWEN